MQGLVLSMKPKTLGVKDNLNKTCIVYQLGEMEYGKAYEIQQRLHHERVNNKISDSLILLEHPPTLTIGKSGNPENILVPRKRLAEEGIAVFNTGRGGDVTYHGPGQLVGYPIIDLSKRGKDVHLYVYELEEVLLQTLKDFSIAAVRDDSHPGVWMDNKEIAAIGLSVKKWVTLHGFALNVNPDLDHFSYINPCGFSERKATSISQILGHEVAMDVLTNHLLKKFSEVFHVALKKAQMKFEKLAPPVDKKKKILWGFDVPGYY